MFVSIIIPVYNDTTRLKKCLECLEHQTYDSNLYEIIVVDNNSDDDISYIQDLYAHVKYLTYNDSASPARCRNVALMHAKGDIIAFTDSDCIPYTTWLEKGVSRLQQHDCDFIGGKICHTYRNDDHPTIFEQYDDFTYLLQKMYVNRLCFAATANMMSYKYIFDDIGGFSTHVHMCDDREWGQRAVEHGYTLYYDNYTRVYHPTRSTHNDLYKKEYRIATGMLLHPNNLPKYKLKGLFSKLPELPPIVKVYKLRHVSYTQKMKFIYIWLTLAWVRIKVYYEYKLKKILSDSTQIESIERKTKNKTKFYYSWSKKMWNNLFI